MGGASLPCFAPRRARPDRDGGGVDAERLVRIKYGMDQVIRLMVETDPGRDGNRGSHRYSFAGAHKQSVKEFAVLIDPPPVLAVLEARQSA